MIRNFNWTPPGHWQRIKTIDLHTGGEPLRVFTGGLPEIKGDTILEKRRYFRENYDHIRTGTMFEPRGHADMYGAVITEPTTVDGDFGVFFMHNEGYSTMCGHAMIALGKLVVETGMIEKGAGQEIKVDAPPGRITLTVKKKNNLVIATSFRNVPSFVLLENKNVHVAGIGRVNFDVAFGGTFYAYVEAKQLGLKLNGSDYNKLIDYGRRIKLAVMENFEISHPFENELGFLYGTIFTGEPYEKSNHSRNVCIFADGEVDRSPTGSGVSGRAAIHHKKGELKPGERITIESILGTTMDVEIIEETHFGPYRAIIPEVTGTAFITGRNEFWFDPDDPLRGGFIFR
nr:proline racemase family protein [Bacteroidota bacterium]